MDNSHANQRPIRTAEEEGIPYLIALKMPSYLLKLPSRLRDAVAALDLVDVVSSILDAHQIDLAYQALSFGIDGDIQEDFVIRGLNDARKKVDIMFVLGKLFGLYGNHLNGSDLCLHYSSMMVFDF